MAIAFSTTASSMRGQTSAAATLMALLCMFSASVTFASATEFPCTKDWVGPNPDNTLDCSGDAITSFIGSVGGMFVPAGIGILFLFPLSCFLVCGRYCCNCCGSSKMRPSSFCGGACCGVDDDDALSPAVIASKYNPTCILVTKLFTVLIVLLGAIGVVLSIIGGTKINDGAVNLNPTVDAVTEWALGIIRDVVNGIQDPVTGALPDGFDEQTFIDVASDIDSYRYDVRDAIEPILPYIRTATLVIAYVSIAPGLVLLMPIIAALCNVRFCLPLVFILLSYFFQFIYFIFSSVVLIGAMAFALLYANVAGNDTSDASTKTLMQWYFIPLCDREAPLDSSRQNLEDMEKDAAVTACTQMQQACSASPAYDTSSMDTAAQIFYCPTLTDPSTDCLTINDVATIAYSVTIKQDVPQAYACGANIPNAECTLEKCATDCPSGSTAQMNSANAVENLVVGLRVKKTFDTVLKPYMSCTALLTKVVDLGIGETLKKLRTGGDILAAGSLMIAIGCFFAVIIGFLGQKRFMNRSQIMEEGGVGNGVVGVVVVDPMQNQPQQKYDFYGGGDKISGGEGHNNNNYNYNNANNGYNRPY